MKAGVKVDPTAFLRVTAVSCLFSTGIIHVLWTALHFREWLGAGIFFLALAVIQTLGAFALVAVPGRLVYLGVAAVDLGTVLVWAVSRTIGMPVGPEAGGPTPVGGPDLVATFLELLTVLAILPLLLRPRSRRGTRAGRMPRGAYLALAAIPVYTLLLTCVVVVPAAVGHGTHAEQPAHDHADH